MNYTPQKIIHNKDVTVVFWEDGTKTLVKKAKGTKYDEHTAFCAALAKKIFGTNSNLKRQIKEAENTKRIKPKKKNGFSLSKEILYSGCVCCGENAAAQCPDAFTENSPRCGAYNKKCIRKLDDFSRPVITGTPW